MYRKIIQYFTGTTTAGEEVTQTENETMTTTATPGAGATAAEPATAAGATTNKMEEVAVAPVVTDEKQTKTPTPVPVPVPTPAETVSATAAGDSADSQQTKKIQQLQERLEFFFGDANVRQDVFLRKLLMYSDTKAVSLEVLLRFNTIKTISSDPALLLRAAKMLEGTLLRIHNDEAVSRVVPFTQELMAGNIPKSFHLTNVPLTNQTGTTSSERQRYNVHVDELLSIFNKYGKVAVCKLKYTSYDPNSSSHQENKHNNNHHGGPRKKKTFFPIGTAMIEYTTEADFQTAAAALVTVHGWGTTQTTVVPHDPVILPVTATRTTASVLGVQTLADHIATCKYEREQRKEHEAAASVDKDVDGDGDTKKRKAATTQDEPDPAAVEKTPNTVTPSTKQYVYDWQPNCVISLQELPEGCDREAILTAISQCAGVFDGTVRTVETVKERNIYVDFSRRQTHGAIRFPEPSSHVQLLATALREGTVQILGQTIATARVLTGEEETEYWTNFIAFKTKQMIARDEERRSSSAHPNSRGGRGGGGRGRGGGGRGRGGGGRGGSRGGYGHKKQRRDR